MPEDASAFLGHPAAVPSNLKNPADVQVGMQNSNLDIVNDQQGITNLGSTWANHGELTQ